MSAPAAAAESGVAFWCDLNGILSEVLVDDFGPFGALASGAPLRDAFDPMSRRKFDQFLAEARTSMAVSGWQMNVVIDGVPRSIHFAGGMTDEKILVIGSEQPDSDVQYLEDLVRINSDQANELRRVIKELVEIRAAASPNDQLSHLSRLNNEMVNLQRELAKRNVELSHLNELKNQFLGMAAHDLRNPLSSVSGFCDLLLMELRDGLEPDQLMMLERIKKNSSFMLNMVEELLDFSKIEAGNLQLTITEIDTRDFIESNLQLNRYIAESKSIALDLTIEESVSKTIWADANKLEQVMNNLISNAIKYSHEQTTTTVTVANVQDMLSIAISDQGQGIPESEIEDLFRPFQITSVQSTGGEKSTGLGLAIVQKIVAGHGGEIRVRSKVGSGTTFEILLPTDRRGQTPSR